MVSKIRNVYKKYIQELMVKHNLFDIADMHTYCNILVNTNLTSSTPYFAYHKAYYGFNVYDVEEFITGCMYNGMYGVKKRNSNTIAYTKHCDAAIHTYTLYKMRIVDWQYVKDMYRIFNN